MMYIMATTAIAAMIANTLICEDIDSMTARLLPNAP
jgi:hypothetical protein